MSFKKMKELCLVAAFLVAAASYCHAQFSANVQGTITDPTGALVVGAQVSITDLRTNIKEVGTTNKSGAYRFDSLLPGDYTISVDAVGFQNAVATRHVGTDETAGVNIVLTVGVKTTTVEVTTAEVGLNPDETRLEYTLSSYELTTIPLPDRSTLTALRVAPGVVGTIETSSLAGNSNISIGQPAPDARANGRPSASNVYLLDRIPITSTEDTAALNIVPNPDMIEEIALQTTTFSVENGATSSLQVDITSKTGGNKYHGDLDYTYTSKPFESNPDFSAGVSPFHRKYIIGSVGGPIVKDHTFFFGSFERADVLAALGATGSGLIGTSFNGVQGIGSWAAAKFPSVAYTKLFTYDPSNLVNQVVTSYASDYYPTSGAQKFGVKCNTTASFNLPCATPVSVNGLFNQNPGLTGQQYNLRLDHAWHSGNDRAYVSYFGVQQNSEYIDPRPAFNTKTPSQGYFYAAGYTHLFSASLVNQINVGLDRYWGGGAANPNYAIFPHGTLFSFFSDAGGVGFAGGPQESPDSPYIGADSKEHVFALREYVSWLKGNSNFKFGFQTSLRNYWQNSSANYSRPYNTWYSDLLEMLQGKADETSLYTISATTGKWTPQIYGAGQVQFGAYAQDEWKIKRNLLVTVGIRWDDYGNPGEYGDNAVPYSNTILGTGSTLLAQVAGSYAKTVSNAFNKGQTWNFMPRVSFSWSPSFVSGLVVHGGLGLYQDSINLNQITANLPTTTPVRLTLTLHDNAEPYGGCFFCGPGQWTGTTAVAGEPDSFAFTGTQGYTPPYGIPYPAIPVTGSTSRGLALGPAGLIYQSNMYGVDPNLKPQSTLIWNYGVEKELVSKLVVGATYTGSSSWNQYLESNSYNSPPGNALSSSAAGYVVAPWNQVGTIELIQNKLRSNYNALVLTAAQRTATLSWQASYLWSHGLGNPGSGDNPSPYTATAGYGTTGLDVHQRMTVSGAYQLPGGSSFLTKGFTLGSIVILQGGTPFSVYTSQDVNNDGNKDVNNDLPNIQFQPGYKLHYGKYSNAQYKAGIFNECVTPVTSSAGTQGSGTLYDPVNFPGCPFQTVTTPNPITLEGNEPYNAFRNPGYWDVDFNLQKKIELPWFGDQKSHLSLRVESLNAFNHVNLNGFGGSIVVGGTGNFGQALSQANPRIYQFGIRFEF